MIQNLRIIFKPMQYFISIIFEEFLMLKPLLLVEHNSKKRLFLYHLLWILPLVEYMVYDAARHQIEYTFIMDILWSKNILYSVPKSNICHKDHRLLWNTWNTNLIPAYKNILLIFRWFIGDMVGVWIGDDESWEQFKIDTNNFGILTWKFEEPNNTIGFLDLTISIEGDRITTKT
jgi:hypothetical protein